MFLKKNIYICKFGLKVILDIDLVFLKKLFFNWFHFYRWRVLGSAYKEELCCTFQCAQIQSLRWLIDFCLRRQDWHSGEHLSQTPYIATSRDWHSGEHLSQRTYIETSPYTFWNDSLSKSQTMLKPQVHIVQNFCKYSVHFFGIIGTTINCFWNYPTFNTL